MSITRSEVIHRAATMWRTGTVPYSQDKIEPATGYRQDCSGFVSMCWGIPPTAAGGWGGQNTVTLVSQGWMREIAPGDLMPGDAVGICGPGSAGDDGHVVLFERWASEAENEDRYWAYEQAGGQSGPEHRIITYPYSGSGGAWRAYRFRDITDGGSMTSIFDEQGASANRAGRTYGQGIDDGANLRDYMIGNGDAVPGNKAYPTPTSPIAQLLAGATSARAVLAELAGVKASLASAGATLARLEARASAPVSPEQIAEIARQTAALIGGGVADVIAARMKE